MRIHITHRAWAEIATTDWRPLRPVDITEDADKRSNSHSAAVIKLSRGAGEDQYRRAAASGAVTLIDPGDGLERVLAAAIATAVGYHVLPCTVAPLLAARLAAPPDHPALATTDLDALRLLREGGKVGDLSELWNVSERHARRRAHVLWEALMATTPTQAIANAVQWGII